MDIFFGQDIPMDFIVRLCGNYTYKHNNPLLYARHVATIYMSIFGFFILFFTQSIFGLLLKRKKCCTKI
jgi:hypothetical protein